MKIVFLDIDGVLNTPKTQEHCGIYLGIDDDKIKLLKQIIESTGAIIILVSTWSNGWFANEKDKKYQDDLANYLDKKMLAYGLKISSSLKSSTKCFRGEQVTERLELLKRNGVFVDSFVIIDNAKEEYDLHKFGNNICVTDENIGLTMDLSKNIIDTLNSHS